MNTDAELIVPLGGTVAAFLIFDAWWLKQRSGWLPAMRWSWRAAGFAALGMLLIGFVITLKVHDPWEPPSLAIAALVATASVYLLRLPEVVLLGQLFLLAAVGQWLNNSYSAHPRLNPWTPWWQPLPIIFASLGLAHWWQRQRILKSVASDPLHLALRARLRGDRLLFGRSSGFRNRASPSSSPAPASPRWSTVT